MPKLHKHLGHPTGTAGEKLDICKMIMVGISIAVRSDPTRLLQSRLVTIVPNFSQKYSGQKDASWLHHAP